MNVIKLIKLMKNAYEYKSVLQNDDILKNENVLINNNHLIHENINGTKLLSTIPENKDFYNHHIIMINITSLMNITNEHIVESNTLYKEIKNPKFFLNTFNSYTFSKYWKLNESIVHDIKVYCDQLISTVYIIHGNNKPDKFQIDSIGDLFNIIDKNENLFIEHMDFLHIINDLDNSYKHSFSNVLSPILLGQNDNCFCNLYSKYGKNVYSPNVLSYKVDDVVTMFNDFLETFKLIVKEYVKC